jgi:hypothetical protein
MEENRALFGPTITEVIKQCKIAFDTHFGTVNIVYFDEHDTPLQAGPDVSQHFIHTLQTWFKYFTKKNQTPTIKIETARGDGFVIAIIPIVHHKVKDIWFQLYTEKEGWKNSNGEYWKDGKRFDVDGKKVRISSNIGLPSESSIVLNTPQDELQVNVMLELLK